MDGHVKRKKKKEEGGEKIKMKINYKKSLKLITLLITSMIIGLASAQIYTYMFLNGTISIVSQKIVWIKEGTTINGDTVTMTFSVQPSVGSNITDKLYLKNVDSADHNMTITVTTEVSTSTFELCKIYIYKNVTDWELVDTLDVTTLNDQYSTYLGNTPLIADGYYKFDFEIKAKSGATGDYSFQITVKYE